MDTADIATTLRSVPEVRVTALRTRVTVHVPAIGDGAHFVADDVRRLGRIYAPDGSPAAELVIDDGTRVWPLIVTGSDLVFEPERPDAVLDASIGYSVADMPPLVAYTEMLRDAEWCGRMDVGDEVDLDTAAGTFLQVRCFVAGAARFGMRPVAAVGWWERGWQRVRDDVYLPPWRVDPLWEGLAAEAAQLPELPSTLPSPPYWG